MQMSQATPKLLIVSSDGSNSGAPNQILILVRGLIKQYDITVCCPDGWLKNKITSLGLPTHPWQDGQLKNQIEHLSALYNRLAPTVIHCHGTRAGIAGRMADRPKVSKVVYTEHLWTKDYHLVNPLRESIQHYFLTKAAKTGDHVIAVSQAVADFVVNKRHVPKNKVTVIYGAITPIQAALPKQVRIGTMGRISTIKGVPVLLEAFAKLQAKFPDIECVIAGDGPTLQDNQDLAERLGIDDRCIWMGEVENPADFYKKIRIYVQPSLSESFGLAAGEAMSCGRVVIASNVGGLVELITDRRNGLLFPVKNSSLLARLLEEVITDQKLFKTLSNQAQKRAEEFNQDRFISEHIALYTKLSNEAPHQ